MSASLARILRFIQLGVLSACLAAATIPGYAASLAASRQAAFADLKVKAEKEGQTRVMVGVELDPSDLPSVAAPQALAAQQRRAAAAKAQDRLVQRLDAAMVAKARHLTHLPFVVMTVDRAELDVLESLPEVVSISEDVLYRTVLSESVPLVGGTAAWSAGFSGNGEIVAVLDTGVDKNHPFLSGKVVSEACYSTTYAPYSSVAVCTSGSTAPGSGTPCTVQGCDHGTHVAGIAAGNGDSAGVSFSGVAKGASLASIQVYSRFNSPSICGGYAPCVQAYLSDITSGLDRVYDLKASYGFNIVSANLSLGGSLYSSQSSCDSSYPPMKQAIDLLRSVNVATVAAAGNEGSTTALSHPGCISTAISVGATTKSDVVDYYSNSAPFLSLLAPGSSIYSSIPGGGYATFSGTSMATPHLAGAWALIRDKTPGASVSDVLEALQSTGIPVTDTRNGLTKPRIQVNAAMGLNQQVPDLTLTLSADTASEIYVNGGRVGSTNNWMIADVFTAPLQAGPNVVVVKARGLRGRAGLLAELDWGTAKAVTDGGWKVSSTVSPGWREHGFNDSAWPFATSYGVYGVAPWYQQVAGFPSTSGAQWIWSDNTNQDQVFFRFTINIGTAPLAVATTSLPDATVGQGYRQQLLANGGAVPYNWSMVSGELPPGISLSSGGTLSGAPYVAGTGTFTVQAEDANGATDTQVLNLTVLPPPPPKLTLTLSVDNASEVYVNGVLLGNTSNWQVTSAFTVPLQSGPNVVAVKANDLGGEAGLLAELNWGSQVALSGTAWKVSPTGPAGWQNSGFDDSAWVNATSYGVYGVAPWYQQVAGFPRNSAAQWIWTSDNVNVDQAFFRLTIISP